MITPEFDWREDEFEKPYRTEGDPQTCVHVARRGDVVAVRNSNHPFTEGPIVEFTLPEWRALRQSIIADGQFDF